MAISQSPWLWSWLPLRRKYVFAVKSLFFFFCLPQEQRSKLPRGAQHVALILTDGKQRRGLDVTSERGEKATELSDQTTERKLDMTAMAPEVFMTRSWGGNGRQAADPWPLNKSDWCTFLHRVCVSTHTLSSKAKQKWNQNYEMYL